MLNANESGYYRWLKNRDKLSKRKLILVETQKILNEHPDNDNYGVDRIQSAFSRFCLFIIYGFNTWILTVLFKICIVLFTFISYICGWIHIFKIKLISYLLHKWYKCIYICSIIEYFCSYYIFCINRNLNIICRFKL